MTDRDTLLQHLADGSRILVVAASGTGNIGDEAMLGGLLARLGRRHHVTVTSANPDETRGIHGVDALSPRQAARALAASDAVVIGGGSLFSAAMGARGRLIPLFGVSALIARKPVSLVGVSVGATPAMNRPLLRTLARHAAEVRVRDRASAARLAAWSVEAVVEPDLSHWLPAAPVDDVRQLLAASGVHFDRPIVGLSLNAVNPQLAASVRAELPQVAAALPEVQFVVVPMSQHPTARHEDDAEFAVGLTRGMRGFPVLPSGLHPPDVIGLFSLFDAAVCMRYHSLVFAERAHVPIVGIPYAEKCDTWLAEHGLPAYPVEAGALAAGIVSALEQRAAPRRIHPGRAAGIR